MRRCAGPGEGAGALGEESPGTAKEIIDWGDGSVGDCPPTKVAENRARAA